MRLAGHNIRPGDLISHIIPPRPREGLGEGRRPGRSRAARLAGRTAGLLAAVIAIIVVAILVFGNQPPHTSQAGGTPARSRTPASTPTPTPTPTPSRTPMPTGVPGDWVLKFDAEFNGTSLDTTQWSTGWYGSGITPPANNLENDCYDPAEVSEGGGALNLSLIQRSENCDGQEPYAGSLVSTMGKFSFTYGFIEARVWLPGVPGNPGEVANWPAVWTDGQYWPYDGEIDIAEGVSGQVCSHFHGPENPDGIGAGGGDGCPSGTYANGWHTFAADWEPGKITYYYDGVDIGSVTSGITSAPQFIILDNAVLDSAYAPATMKVAYVRVWQHP